MYQSINFSNFVDAFNAIRPNNFSYDGLEALFNYLEEYEEATDSPLELDVIALCSEFTEYATLDEAISAYSYTIDRSDFETPDELLEELEAHTIVIAPDGVDGIIIIKDF